MKKWMMFGLVFLLVVGAAQAQDTRRLKSTIVNSDHDLRGLVGSFGFTLCSYCHTAHQPPEANAVDPLWNHELSAVASYGVYDSDTMNATPQELAGGTTASNLCLSCHDGTVAVNALYNQGSIPDTPGIFVDADHQIGAGADTNGLTDDHPVNFLYDAALAAADGGLVTPVSSAHVDVDLDLPLFGGFMQCASCHDAHNGGAGPFLRRRLSTQVTICLECHS